METIEFFKLAQERFGSKIFCNKINIKKYNSDVQDYLGVTKESIENYPEQAWLLEDKCPNCGVELLGFSGSFTWDITHGYGHCDNCKKVSFKYYHYIDDKKPALQAFAVTGF